MKSSALFLLLLVATASARDPFLAPPTGRCPDVAPPAWRLQGIIGRAGSFAAWLRLPTGKRLRVGVNDRLPGSDWRVARIDMLSMTLADGLACWPPLTLVLKGERDVKDDRAGVAADADAQRAGHKGRAALAGL